jgi:hypothetical protein
MKGALSIGLLRFTAVSSTSTPLERRRENQLARLEQLLHSGEPADAF